MSMTQVAFLKKADLPTKTEIEEIICDFGYDFEIIDEFESFQELDGLQCKINGQTTFFEVYLNEPNEITQDFDFIAKDLSDQDKAVSFVRGADFAAGAVIGLICVALIIRCNALVYYLDDEIVYSKEMLLSDIPEFLKEVEKQKKYSEKNQNREAKVYPNKKGFWNRIKKMLQ